MTLIVVIPANDGIIIGSDTQLTYGETRSFSQKIKAINNNCLWAAAGDSSLIQLIEGSIKSLDRDRSLIDLKEDLINEIKKAHSYLLECDMKSSYFRGDPKTLFSLFSGDFLFAEYKGYPFILRIDAHGVPEFIDRCWAIGGGDLFAFTLLHKYQYFEFDVKTAAVVMYKVLDEAIQVGSYGLGHPIDIWRMDNAGIKQFSGEEYRRVYNQSIDLINKEVGLLKEIGT